MFVFGYPDTFPQSCQAMREGATHRHSEIDLPFWEPTDVGKKNPVLFGGGSNRIISLWVNLDEAMFCVVVWCVFLQDFVCWF